MCECVCYLARVFYQDQTAARALATEDSALLSALAGMIILFMQKVGATEVACVQGKTVKAGDFVKGFHPPKSHATHPDHLKTQVESPVLVPCSRATRQPSPEEARTIRELTQITFLFHQGTTASCTSQTSGDFPLSTIVVNRRRSSCSKMTANKLFLINVFVLHLKETSLRGVDRTL